MRYLSRPVYLLPLLALLASCSWIQSQQLSPERQLLWSLNVYNAQYQLYLDQVINPDLDDAEKNVLRANPDLIKGDKLRPGITEDEWKILRVKKDILVELKKVVLLTEEYHKTGTLPPAEVQREITNLINRLLEVSS